MKLIDLFSLQGTLFAMMLIGALLKKKGMIDDNGKRCLSDLCIHVIIPCNIFKSCLIDLQPGIFRTCGLLLVSAVLLQLLALTLNRFLYNRYPEQKKKVLQYCTIVPMSGFLGNPIAEGLYSSVGVLYTSTFLIPMRMRLFPLFLRKKMLLPFSSRMLTTPKNRSRSRRAATASWPAKE